MATEAFANARLLTTNQAATYLGVHRSTIRRLVLNGSLPRLNTFKSWRVDRADLDLFIEREKAVL
jgi:excisionase family DNA binding protein